MKSKILYILTVTLLVMGSGAPGWAQNTSPFWSLAGNNNAASTNKFGTTNASSLRFVTNNTDRLTITSGGNIGIGSTNPNGKLHINSPTGVSPLRVQTNGSDKFLMHMNGGLSIGSGQTPPSNGLYVAGKFGLGVASPQALFHIPSKGNLSLSTTDNFLVGDTNSYNLAFDYNKIQARYDGGGLNLLLNPNGSAVGIGTEYADFQFATTIKPPQAGHGILMMDAHDGYILYGSKSGSGYGMRLQSYYRYNEAPVVYSYTSGRGAAIFGEIEGQEGNIYVTAVQGNAKHYGTAVKGQSQLGLGVMAESSYSHGIYATTGPGHYAGYFGGSVYASGYYGGSDEKLKRDIGDMGSAIEIIRQLRPKHYQFRHDGNFKHMRLPEGEQYGLIAQDVEKILPGIVKDSEFDPGLETLQGTTDSGKLQQPNLSAKPETIRFKAVDYTALIPILIKAVQEQEEQNNVLKQELRELRKTVQQMQTGTSKKTIEVSGSLEQNIPNPARTSTTVSYTIPTGAGHAQLLLTDNNGKTIRTISLATSGATHINTTTLTSGVYHYSLIIDGQLVETKKLIVTR